MDVAVLTARLEADMAAFQRNMATADAAMAAARANAKSLEGAIASIGDGMAAATAKVEYGSAAQIAAMSEAERTAQLLQMATGKTGDGMGGATAKVVTGAAEQVAALKAVEAQAKDTADAMNEGLGSYRADLAQLISEQKAANGALIVRGDPGATPLGPATYNQQRTLGIPGYQQIPVTDMRQMETFITAAQNKQAVLIAAETAAARAGGGNGLTSLIGVGVGTAAGGGGGSNERGLMASLGFGAATAGAFGGNGGIRLPRFGRWGGFNVPGAAMGSIGGLAGFGAEHVLTSGVGIAGSAVGAGIGGGLLAGGAVSTAAVGIGTDLAGIGQAAGDIKTTTTNLNALQTAIQEYGKNSTQAATAQATLNQGLAGFSPVAKQAVLAASQTAIAFKQVFDAATGAAEKTGAQIIQQAMMVGVSFLPTIGKFAAQNMDIIKKDIQPLFTWLQNPMPGGGLGIFDNLEKIFQGNLPTAISAITQGFELFAKTMNVAAGYTGGFTQKLDDFFTKWNSGAHFDEWAAEVGKLIDLFRVWMSFFGSLGSLLINLFKPSIGFGEQFIEMLTSAINSVKNWLGLTGTQDTLHNLFAAHLLQVQGLFAVLKSLGPVLAQVADSFMKMETVFSAMAGGALKVLADILTEISKIPFISVLAGWTIGFFLMRAAIVAVSGWMLKLVGVTTAGGAEMTAALAPVEASMTLLGTTTAGTATMIGTTLPAAAATGAAETDVALSTVDGALASMAGAAEAAAAAVAGIGAAAMAAIPGVLLLVSALAGYEVAKALMPSTVSGGYNPAGTAAERANPGKWYNAAGQQVVQVGTGANTGVVLAPTNPALASTPFKGQGTSGPQTPAQVAAAASAKSMATLEAQYKALEAKYAAAVPTSGGGGGGGGGGGAPAATAANTAATAAQTALSNANSAYNNSVAGSEQQIVAAVKLQTISQQQLATLTDISKTHKLTVAQLAQESTLNGYIAATQKTILTDLNAQVVAAKSAAAFRLLGLSPTGNAVQPGAPADRASLASINSLVNPNNGLGLDTKYVQDQVKKINDILKNGLLTPQDQAAVAQSLTNLRGIIHTHLAAITTDMANLKAEQVAYAAQIVAAITAMKLAALAAKQAAANELVTADQAIVTTTQNQLNTYVSQLISAADTAFQQQTDSVVQQMQDSLTTNLQNLQVMVNSAAGSFLYGGAITTTPAQDQLTALQNAQTAQQNTMALTQAQQNLTIANAGGDPQTIATATQAVADAQYQIQVTALTLQANTQQTAAQTQLTTAQNAYQEAQQAEITNYQDQRTIQQQAMDNQLADLQNDMAQYPALSQFYLNAMLKTFTDNGVDLSSASFVVGDGIATSLAQGLSPIDATITNLLAQLATLATATSAAAGITIQAQTLAPGYEVVYINGRPIVTTPGVLAASGATQLMGGGYTMPAAAATQWFGMASGGMGTVTKPTMFLAGEAGTEQFAFSGAGRSFGGGSDQPMQQTVVIQLDGKTIAMNTRKYLLRFGRSNTTIFTGNGINA